MLLTDWAKRMDIPQTVLLKRHYTYGWSADRMFTQPVRKSPKRKK